MATRTPNFSVVPEIPQAGLDPAQYQLLLAMKQNVDLLTGAVGTTAAAVRKGQVQVGSVTQASTPRLTAQGLGAEVDGVQLVRLDDYGRLLSDVSGLIADVNALRNTLNVLLQQLKA